MGRHHSDSRCISRTDDSSEQLLLSPERGEMVLKGKKLKHERTLKYILLFLPHALLHTRQQNHTKEQYILSKITKRNQNKEQLKLKQHIKRKY